jgi:N-acetylglucosaminyldiphosphoundecaprenol N-acetyl-beta-D-mannosaminyltransferase
MPLAVGAERAGLPSMRLYGMPLASIDSATLLEHMFGELAQARGGWVLTANLDFLRRYVHQDADRALFDAADLCVADGMPLVWASRVQGAPLPERVAGSSLVWRIAERAAREGRSLYLLGGAPGAAEGAEREFLARWPELRIAGRSSPMVSATPTLPELDALRVELMAARPDILLVGMGSPKQERIIHALRAALPCCWMLGVGISFSFVTGQVRRAPPWMRRGGLEWVHRLAQEPRRLARRYLVEDLPFAAALFAHAARERLQGR